MERVSTCKACGKKFAVANRLGRAPARCEACKHPYQRSGTRERKSSRERSKRRAVRVLEVADEAMQLAELAAVLSIWPKQPEVAAKLIGIDPAIHDVRKMAREARKRFPDLAKGETAAVLRFMTGIVSRLLVQLMRKMPELHPRDCANAIGQIEKARALMLQTQAGDDFADVVVEFRELAERVVH